RRLVSDWSSDVCSSDLATIPIDNLLQGDAFHRPATAGLWELGLCLLAGAGVTLLLVRAPSWWSALIALGMVAGVWAGCEWALLGTGILLSPMPATVALAFSFPALTLLNYLLEKKRADRVEGQL